MNEKRRRARHVALQALYAWEVTRQPIGELLRFDWLETDKDIDLDFARLLVAGVVEHVSEIDDLIQANIRNWEMERLSRVDLAILRQGVFSLLFQRDIDSHITIDEAVELAHEFSSDESYRFINGVLDAILKSDGTP